MLDPNLHYPSRRSSVNIISEIMAGRDPYADMEKDWQQYQMDLAAEDEISDRIRRNEHG